MFYNSKKLIDEKVLQQYYFEKFMLSNAGERKLLLPEKFQEYSITKAVKGLNPEIRVGEKKGGGNHITDFVLYPMPKLQLDKLNIELKWGIKDFERQPERFPYYNGEISSGFVVAIKDSIYTPEAIDNGKIPVVYIDGEEFKKWFTKKSYSIVSQALANKLSTKPSRLSGEKVWVVTIVKSSLEHYMNHGRKKGIWAFRDNNNPKNIMNILGGDYVIFVGLGHCNPGRCVYPFSINPNREFETSRGGKIKSKDISWAINLLDIGKVNKGYHLNYTDRPPYHGFDEKWMASKERTPETKDYTQFVTFVQDNDELLYKWNKPQGNVLDRKLFYDNHEGLCEFIDAVRTSMNTKGDAVEISRDSFESLRQLIDDF